MEEWLEHVNNWRRWLLLIGFWLGSLVCGQGQTFELARTEDQIAPAPADGVVDQAGLGHRNPALIAKLKEDIRRLRDDHGFHLYVVLESVLVSGNSQLVANRLRRSWIPNGDGMVLVFELDTKSLGIGQSFEQEADPTKAPPGQVPSYETMAILEEARDVVNADNSSEAMMESFVGKMVAGYNEYFTRKNAPVPQERTVKVGLIIVGAAAALALLGMLAALLVKRSDRRGGGRCYYFPEVQMSERLGAPYGGGEVSSRRFGRGGQS